MRTVKENLYRCWETDWATADGDWYTAETYDPEFVIREGDRSLNSAELETGSYERGEPLVIVPKGAEAEFKDGDWEFEKEVGWPEIVPERYLE